MRRAVVVLALLLTGCDSGGGTDRDAAGSTTTTVDMDALDAAKPAPTPEGDKAKAQAIVLTEADAGPGFAAGNPTDEEAAATDETLFEGCTGGNAFLDPADDTRSAEIDLAKDQNTSIGSFAELAPDDATAAAAFAVVKGDVFLTCFGELTKRVTELVATTDGGRLAAFSYDKKTIESTADDAVAIDTVAEVKGDFQARWHDDVVMLRTGRVFAALIFYTAGDPYPQAEKERLITLTVDRMKAAAT